jgi:4-amino-4-deoxy-L-arabinose transferase-like glycosyltransferase
MLLVTGADPALHAYRDNILFTQTVERYAAASHHHKDPFYYFWSVIPGLWQPLVLLAPLLALPWWRRLKRGDMAIGLCLAWAALVVIFFSFSTGKRGVYILPALPAVALAAGPVLAAWHRRLRDRWHRGLLVPAAVVCAIWIIGGWVAYPLANPTVSARPFMAEVGQRIGADGKLGLLNWKEQFRLYADRPVQVFAYRTKSPQALIAEFEAGLAWVVTDDERWLLGPETMLDARSDVPDGPPGFFAIGPETFAGERHRERWHLVRASDLRPAGRAYAEGLAATAAASSDP